jgi:hypothetical protein
MMRFMQAGIAALFLMFLGIGAAHAESDNYCFVDAGPPIHWAPCSSSNPLVTSGGGGGGGAVTIADGADVTLGAKADAAAADGAATASLIAVLKGVLTAAQASVPAGSNNIGNVNSASNVTLTDCSGTIATGGTAQNAFTAQTTLHGFHIENIDASAGSGEPMWINETGTAAAATVGSDPLPAPSATTFTGMGSYYTVNGNNHAVSIVAATTGHKYSCKWW